MNPISIMSTIRTINKKDSIKSPFYLYVQLRYILWRNDKRHQFNSKNELIGYLIDYIELDIFIKE